MSPLAAPPAQVTDFPAPSLQTTPWTDLKTFRAEQLRHAENYGWVDEKLGIAHVPEGRQLFPSLTVMENLQVGAQTTAGRRDWSQNIDRILSLLPVAA